MCAGKIESAITVHGALHPAARHPANKAVISDIQPLAARRLFNELLPFDEIWKWKYVVIHLKKY